MQLSTYDYLQRNPEIANFVRNNPTWYRYLTRDPDLVNELNNEAKIYYGRTFPQRMEQLNNGIQMIGMFMQFAGSMKD